MRPFPTRRPRAHWTGCLVALMGLIVALYGIVLGIDPLSADGSMLFQKFASSVVFFGAVALCVWKGHVARGERFAWWLFALAMAVWGMGSVYYSIVLWDLKVIPYPSIADGFWIGFYPLVFAALLTLLRKRAGSARKGVWLDALVGGLGVGGAAAATAFQSVLDSTPDNAALATVTNLAYPVGDMGLLALVVAAITVTGWKASGVWRWIASAFAIFAVTDSIYLIKVAAGTYETSHLLDLGWPLAALLVGIAAWRPAARANAGTTARAASRAATLVPALCGFAALGLLVADHFERTNVLALGLATASLLVLLVRLCLTVQDNIGLLTHSRQEAMTDALTGLGNRRQLAADLAEQLGDLELTRPLVLTLFDLDGFKHYNDTFGHPAGDQLLTRLGGRLRDLMADRGTAYRMGGDEFCTLWICPAADAASIITMEAAAVAALSERGEAFSITSSYGSVQMPLETVDGSEALRIADRQMYIRKRGGRPSAAQQSADVLQRALAECDSELDVHLGTVAELAYISAMRLGVCEEDAQAARQTALLHDVGKVAIPDAILNKPGKLDAAEWAFMKRHTIIGERIISAAPSLAVVAKLVRATHERYDGSGYPDGLAGGEIPLIARIVAVCDSYDAMTTTRAYRAAHERGWAVAELRRSAGTQFDPAVVEAVIGALEARERETVTNQRRTAATHA